MLQAKLKDIVRANLNKVRLSSFASANFEIEILAEYKNGRADFACAIAKKLAHNFDTSPKTLAQTIANGLNDRLLDRVEVAENGFINLFVSREALAMSVQNLLSRREISQLNDAQPTEYLGQDPEFFGLQYARHRLSAALRQLTESRINLIDQSLMPPLMDSSQWMQTESLYLADMHVLEPAFDDNLVGCQLAAANRKLALFLDEFCPLADKYRVDQIEGPVRAYMLNLVREINRVHFLDCLLLAAPPIRNARIGLIVAAKRVLGDCLGILDLEVPEKL